MAEQGATSGALYNNPTEHGILRWRGESHDGTRHALHDLRDIKGSD